MTPKQPPSKPAKSQRGRERATCACCGRRHYLRPEYVGTSASPLCTTCKRELDGASGED